MSDSIGVYFSKLRHSDLFHIGLGDVRLTKGMQDEVIAMFHEQAAEIENLKAQVRWLDDLFQNTHSRLSDEEAAARIWTAYSTPPQFDKDGVK